jgi:hypothetical protein
LKGAAAATDLDSDIVEEADHRQTGRHQKDKQKRKGFQRVKIRLVFHVHL